MAELQSLLGCKCCVLTQSAGLRERTTRAWSTCRNWKGFRFQFRWNRVIHLRNHNQLWVSGETVIDLYFTGESTKVNGNKNNGIKIDKENCNWWQKIIFCMTTIGPLMFVWIWHTWNTFIMQYSLNSCVFVYIDNCYHGNVVSRDPLVQRNWNRFHYKTKRNFDKWITLLIWKNLPQLSLIFSREEIWPIWYTGSSRKKFQLSNNCVCDMCE